MSIEGRQTPLLSSKNIFGFEIQFSFCIENNFFFRRQETEKNQQELQKNKQEIEKNKQEIQKNEQEFEKNKEPQQNFLAKKRLEKEPGKQTQGSENRLAERLAEVLTDPSSMTETKISENKECKFRYVLISAFLIICIAQGRSVIGFFSTVTEHSSCNF